MLRKTLVTLTAVAALSIGSTAFAMHGGGGGGGGGGWGGGGGGGGHGWSGGGGAGFAATHGAAISPAMHGGPTGPVTTGRVQGWNGGRSNVQGWNGGRSNLAWGGHNHFHDRFHDHFRNNRFFAFGFGGPFYDYAAYDSCWAQVPTYYGWQWVYVCGDYGYS